MENKKNVLYLIGSLRNTRIPELANRLREQHPSFEIFDDWYSAGPEADDYWKAHQQGKGSDYKEALRGWAARHVFDFDRTHLNRSTHALLVLPAGKSGHMEIMYAQYATQAKTAILLDPDDVRWDVMYQFIPNILHSDNEIGAFLEETTTTSSDRNEARPRETEDGFATLRAAHGNSKGSDLWG